jgi:lipopolysaccharide heptosyltransferase II
MQLIKNVDRYLGIPICYLLHSIDSLKPKPKPHKIKNILAIKLSGFGNLILSLPALRSIKRKFPESKITYLTQYTNKELLEGVEDIDDIIYLKVKGHRLLYDLSKVLSKIKRKKIDLVIDFEQFARVSTILSYLSNAKKRIGFNTKKQGRGMLYTTKVNYNNNQHMIKTFYDLAVALGIKPKTFDTYEFPKLSYSETDQRTIENYTSNKKKKIVCIHPGTGKNVPERKWNKDKFAKLADELIEKYNASIFFTGTKDELKLIKSITSKMRNKFHNLAGKLSLRQLSLFISKSDLLITNDTGPLHLASFNKIPSISFFGPNTPKLYGPIGNNHITMYKNMHCSPCITNFNEKSTNCKHFECLKSIQVKDVLTELSKNNILK